MLTFHLVELLLNNGERASSRSRAANGRTWTAAIASGRRRQWGGSRGHGGDYYDGSERLEEKPKSRIRPYIVWCVNLSFTFFSPISSHPHVVLYSYKFAECEVNADALRSDFVCRSRDAQRATMALPTSSESSSVSSDTLSNHHQIAHTRLELALHNPGPTSPNSPELRHILQHLLAESRAALNSNQFPTYGPENPYDPYTDLGRAFIERRDLEDFPNSIDRWLQANMCAWHRDDPRLLSTDVLSDHVECTIEMIHFPVCLVTSSINVSPSDLTCTQETTDSSSDDSSDVPGLVEDEHFALVITAEFLYGWVDSQWLSSPPAVLEIIYGDTPKGFGPDWGNMLEVGQTYTFRQPRSLVVDLFAYLAVRYENIEKVCLSFPSGFFFALVEAYARADRSHVAGILRQNTGVGGCRIGKLQHYSFVSLSIVIFIQLPVLSGRSLVSWTFT